MKSVQILKSVALIIASCSLCACHTLTIHNDNYQAKNASSYIEDREVTHHLFGMLSSNEKLSNVCPFDWQSVSIRRDKLDQAMDVGIDVAAAFGGWLFLGPVLAYASPTFGSFTWPLVIPLGADPQMQSTMVMDSNIVTFKCVMK